MKENVEIRNFEELGQGDMFTLKEGGNPRVFIKIPTVIRQDDGQIYNAVDNSNGELERIGKNELVIPYMW